MTVTIPRRRFIAAGAAAMGGVAFPRTARTDALSYPSRLIKVVVPFPPGGPTDLMGRLAAQQLSSGLRQKVIVENVAGAGGTIGSQAVARAAPDGYTLLLGGTNSNSITSAFYKNLSYDPIEDFTPIASIGVDSSALVVAAAVPAKTIEEFLHHLKSNPGKLACGAPVGIAPHAMVASFVVRSNADMVFVPYRGGAPLITDLLGGQVHMTFGAKSAFLPHVQSGKLRALAVTSEGRWPELPDIPTMRESGFADFPTYQWFVLLAPAKTPSAVVDRLNATINAGLKSPEFQTSLAKLGVEAKIQTPSGLQKILLAEAGQWQSIVRSTKIKLE